MNEQPSTTGKMKCQEIRDVLFDYMARELGNARSGLVREHLRKCEDCQAAAAEIQKTLDALAAAAGAGTGLPERLTDDRRRRIARAITHPVIFWLERHHIIVSLAIALIALIATLVFLRDREMWYSPSQDEVITVTIGTGTPPEKPPPPQAPQ